MARNRRDTLPELRIEVAGRPPLRRNGGGTPALPPDLRRSVRLTARLRPAQAADLRAIAAAWGVTEGTAAWAIVTRFLAAVRSTSTAELHEVSGQCAACRELARPADLRARPYRADRPPSRGQ